MQDKIEVCVCGGGGGGKERVRMRPRGGEEGVGARGKERGERRGMEGGRVSRKDG